MRFDDDLLQLDGERINQEWKPTWRRLKAVLQKGIKQTRIEMYESKEQQNRLFKEQEPECHLWLTKNPHPRKTSSIMSMLEQMIETKSWKVARELAEDGMCRVCYEQIETVGHLVASCKVLANTRHNRALMILAITWAKEHELVGTETVWYKERWERGTVLENNKAKLIWDVEFKLRKTTTSR